MAYKLGQLTKIEGADYVQTIKCSAGTFSTKFFAQDMLNDIVFLDESIYPESSLVASETYYLSFKVDRMTVGADDEKKKIDFSFDILLKDSALNEQYVRTIKIEKGLSKDEGGEPAFVNIIFTPNDVYNTIVFSINRTVEDFMENKTKKMSISDINLQKIENILPENINMEKIGIQAPSGMLFTINGEEIMIGRTGIYELYNKDIPITYLGFVTKKDDNKFFIVDYQYKEGN
jgi:hypothetical protein